MVASSSRQLGELLVERKVLSRDDLAVALQREAAEGVALSTLLVREGQVAEKDLIAAVAQQVGVAFVDLATRAPRPDLVGLVPTEMAERLVAVAVDVVDDRLVVALANPSDHEAVAQLGEATGYEICPALAVRHELVEAIAAAAAPGPVTVGSGAELRLDDLLAEVLDRGASDLHLVAGSVPCVRVHGEIERLEGRQRLTGSVIRRVMYEVLTQRQRERFEEHLELDTSYALPGRARFRVNMMVQRDSVGAVLRAIPSEIVPFDDLELPASVKALADAPRGLVLVTGPTGSGKSTTLASLVDLINVGHKRHILTIEDPIEFVHRHKTSIITQREVGEDTRSFATALKHVLRQDPDVVLLGEMRDLETISTALTAAETGHLVLATLHTQDAPQSVDRMIDVFPASQQQQVRTQLAVTLQGIVTQTLVPQRDGRGRVAACEVLVATPAVRNLIREGKPHQIYSVMQAGAKHGMQTMDQSLAAHVRAGRIDMAAAIERCSDVANLTTLVGRAAA